jgi:hypothetical protein
MLRLAVDGLLDHAFPEHTMVDGVLHLTDELSDCCESRARRARASSSNAPSAATVGQRVSSEQNHTERALSAKGL